MIMKDNGLLSWLFQNNDFRAMADSTLDDALKSLQAKYDALQEQELASAHVSIISLRLIHWKRTDGILK